MKIMTDSIVISFLQIMAKGNHKIISRATLIDCAFSRRRLNILTKSAAFQTGNPLKTSKFVLVNENSSTITVCKEADELEFWM